MNKNANELATRKKLEGGKMDDCNFDKVVGFCCNKDVVIFW